MTTVFFKKASYEYEILKPIIFEMMDKLLGVQGSLALLNARVLIKPNFLTPASPEKAVLTHPLVVKSVAEYLLEKGASPIISDSPATGAFRKILREGGYQEAFKELDVEFRAFEESIKVDIGEPFGKIDMAKEVMEADMVINLPKLKTHSQMLLTLGVKNMFGTIVGLKKPEWHLRCGIERGIFAKLLVRIYSAINPTITLIDGILALEGNGPGKAGIPREIGILAGSTYAPAADMAICKMLGIAPEKLPTHKVAKELGLIGDTVQIKGDFKRVDNFKFPEQGAVTFGPKALRGILRKHLVQRPVTDPHLCKLCGECWKYCPAKAINPPLQTMPHNKKEDLQKPEFDYDKCIRCYCCIEVCPHGALRAAETPVGKLLRKLPLRL